MWPSWGGREEEEGVTSHAYHSTLQVFFRPLIYLRLRWAVTDVHEGLGRVEPEDAQSPVRLVGQQQRHGPVQAEAGVQLEGEGVQVIEAVGFPVPVRRSRGGLEREEEKPADASDLVSLSCRSSACSGTPYTWLKPWKQRSAPTLQGPGGERTGRKTEPRRVSCVPASAGGGRRPLTNRLL